MNHNIEQNWHFRVCCPHADRVYLVKKCHSASTAWVPMSPVGSDEWELDLPLIPGSYQFSYFTAEGDTFINGGTYGLSITEPDSPHPDVMIQHEEQAVPVSM